MPHDTRDAIVDYVRNWATKSDISVSLLLRWVGITTSKYHDWIKRFGKVNEHNSLVPRDHWLTDDEKERIRNFARVHPLEGYRRLTFMMLDADVVACSPTSVYRVLKAAHLLAGSSPLPTKKGTGFVQPLAAHAHWHVDVSYLNIAGTFYFLCSVLDGYSRAIVHHEIREKMEESDIEVILQRAREAHPGVTPRIISDNGPQFLAKDFKEFIRLAGMTHVKTSPYYPQSNGKIERWHKTLKGESIRVSVPLSLEDARRIVADYVTHYNTVRLHSAIGYITPQDKLEGRDEAIFAARDRKLAEAREHRAQLRQRVGTDTSVECQRVVTVRPTIDFAAVKSRIGIGAVLKLLGIEATKSQHRGSCPLHGSTRGTARCFSANGQKNVFHCFKCGQSGNALELWAKATQQTPYDAALDLCGRLGIELPMLNHETGTEKRNP
ncbi:MAG: integrase core domain-containing protein [Planctomycetia bacterium]|nr:integrase core domain-containing protein [Planctomycetia bacterium]